MKKKMVVLFSVLTLLFVTSVFAVPITAYLAWGPVPATHSSSQNANIPVPAPATLLFLGLGLVGVSGFTKKSKTKSTL